MSMKAMLGAVITLILAVGGVALLTSVKSRPVVEPVPVSKDDMQLTNPFEGAAASKDAKVKVDETHFEFDRMGLGDSMSHEFVFTNTGTAPLLLAKGPMQCKCTMPTVSQEPIVPGQSAKITLTWKPEAASKDFQKTAVIWTNDADRPRVELSIHGAVAPDPAVLPGMFSVGNVRWSHESTAEVNMVSAMMKDLQITEVKTSDPELQVEFEPWTDKDFTAWVEPDMAPPVAGYRIRLKLLPVNKSGPFRGLVTLKTNHKNGDVTIPIDGVRVGPILIQHTNYQQTKGELNLGRFKSDVGKELTVKAFLQPFGQDLQISGVECDPKHLKIAATLQKNAAFKGENRELYDLTIQVPPGVPKGGYPNMPVLRMKTNHPDAPELTLKLQMVVQ